MDKVMLLMLMVGAAGIAAYLVLAVLPAEIRRHQRNADLAVEKRVSTGSRRDRHSRNTCL